MVIFRFLVPWVVWVSVVSCIDHHEIVVALREHWNVCGLFLLQSQDHDHAADTWTSVGLQKLLSVRGISSAVTSFQLTLDSTPRCGPNSPLYVLLSGDRFTQEFLTKMSTNSRLSASKWLLFLEETKIQDFFREVHVPFNCEFLVARVSKQTVALSEVYRVGPKESLQVHHYGTWTLHNGTTWSAASLYRRRNMNGFVINATYIPEENFFSLNQPNESGNPEVDGYFGLTWRSLEALLNFKTNYMPSKDGLYGSMLENGTFNGMVYMIQHNEAHVSSSQLMMNSKRASVVDYINPLLEERSHIFVKQDDTISMRWTDYVRPFSKGLWGSVIGVVFVLTLSLCLLRQAENQDSIQKWHFSAVESLFSVLASFCMQGQDCTLWRYPIRLLLVTSYGTAVVLLSGYSASLISTLTSRTITAPFYSFQDLIDDGSYKIGVLIGSAQFDNFKEMADPTARRVFTNLIAPYEGTMPENDMDGLQRVCHEKNYAYMAELLETISMSSNLSCRVIPIPKAFMPATLAMAIAKQSPYRMFFNYYIQEMRRVGILQRLQRLTLKTQLLEVDSPTRVVNLTQVTPVFSILILGTALAIVILFTERFIHRHNHNCRTDDNKNRNASKISTNV